MIDFIGECRSVLDKHWEEIIKTEQLSDTSLPPEIREAIKQCINSKTLTYRYVLPTQVLAKITDKTLDSRSIQVASGIKGAFDARSLCHKVIVPFDKNNEDVLGGANEPYINNPIRVPTVSAEYRGDKKDKTGWDALCAVLDTVEQKNDPNFTELVFKQILIEIHNRLDQVKVTYPIPTRVSIDATLMLIEKFISMPSGGEHPQSVTYAIFKTIGEWFELYDNVKRSKINASDDSSDQIVDIECYDSDKIVMAIEVKDKKLTVEQIKSKIDVARSKKVSELLFIAQQGINDLKEWKDLRDHEFSSGQNIYVYNLMDFLPSILILLGEEGRRDFLEHICDSLDKYADIKSRLSWAKMLSEL